MWKNKGNPGNIGTHGIRTVGMLETYETMVNQREPFVARVEKTYVIKGRVVKK